jgi:biotin carboxylase
MKKFLFIEMRPTEFQSLHLLRELGYTPVLFARALHDNDGELYKSIDLGQMDSVHEVETTDVAAMLALIQTLKLDIGGVLGAHDEVAVAAAQLAQQLGLPHPDIQGLKNAFFKHDARAVLERAGIRQPVHAVVELSAMPLVPPLDYPFVMKPVRDAGAFCVHLCRNLAQYRAAVADLQHNHTSYIGSTHKQLLLEEFVEGDFYGAELLWCRDQWKILDVNRIFVDPNKSLCMTGISYPASLPQPVSNHVEQEILRWVTLLGLRGGAINVEFKLRNGEPVLIEVNLRLAGARISRQIELTSGVVVMQHIYHQALGIDDGFIPPRAAPGKFVADAFVFCDTPGKVIGLDSSTLGGEHLIDFGLKSCPFVVSSAAQQDFGDIIGYVLASGDSCEAAMANAREQADRVRFVLAQAA